MKIVVVLLFSVFLFFPVHAWADDNSDDETVEQMIEIIDEDINIAKKTAEFAEKQGLFGKKRRLKRLRNMCFQIYKACHRMCSEIYNINNSFGFSGNGPNIHLGGNPLNFNNSVEGYTQCLQGCREDFVSCVGS